jgi:hypothetical protein
MSDAIEDVQVRRLFMLLHGMYGNAVLDKYRTGQTEDNGEDVGMATARAVWLNGLREFDTSIVMKALGRCAEKHKTFPPTLPEFRDLCKAFQPARWDATKSAPMLEMSDALRAEHVERARRVVTERRLQREGAVQISDGLPGLHVLIAKAVGYAGGDEAATLLRLDATRSQR